jgi:hypothetical protein
MIIKKKSEKSKKELLNGGLEPPTSGLLDLRSNQLS